MKLELETALLREAKKLIRRHSSVTSQAAEYRKRYQKRTGKPAGAPATSVPDHWAAEVHFDPFYVRARSNGIAHALAQKIRNNTYNPKPSLHKVIPKAAGGQRTLSIFTVTDSAVSYWLFKKLLDRNSQFFSSYSYAYRADRNAHHAIEHVSRFTRGRQRLFLLEYDFSKYFDSIRHSYLMDVIDKHLRASPRERSLIESFLRSRYAEGTEAYKEGLFSETTLGIPQGTSLSLFLANVACLELDRDLEKTGAVFARYADDTVILCEEYSTACQVASLMLAHGDRSGAGVNFEKSEGISLIAPDSGAEMKSKPAFAFLGHEISSSSVRVAKRTLARMKRNLARIIHRHLLLYPIKKQFNKERINPSGTDWDLVTCINELRNYLYGRISEKYLSEVLSRSSPLKNTRCALSYFPLVDSPQSLRELDGWLVRVLHSAYAKRARVLKAMGYTIPVIGKDHLISGDWYKQKEIPNETKLPSAFRAWLYVRKCYNTFGLRYFPSPLYRY